VSKAILVLEDGTVFSGQSIGVSGHTVGEVVFNTAMTGYQEIFTDPSYCRQIVTLTYPHIGNVGINDEDNESSGVFLSGIVVRDVPPPSNWRAESSLIDFLQKHQVIAIAGIDTRKMTRVLREKGAQRGCIMAGENLDEGKALSLAKGFPGLQGMDLAQEVTTSESYQWTQGEWTLTGFQTPPVEDTKFHVVAYDFGVKRNILRMLASRGCRLTVVPAKTTAEEVLALSPDGVFLSNGPGDPEPCDYAIKAIQKLIERNVPMFGICLGHQLLSLACGAKTVKMKFGHHGANHPVLDTASQCVMVSSQNHGFAVDEKSLPEKLKATHRSLFDQSLQGIQHQEKPVFGFQGHPEASPGPHDVAHLFDHFIQLMSSSN
jgi:carbamoyl-phosphate synthase small subunit